MTNKTTISTTDYNTYKNCSPGDGIKATAKDGTQYIATIQTKTGATIIAKTTTGKLLEFRVFHDGPRILLGIDGKNALEDLGTTTGKNKHGVKITEDKTRINMDKIIVQFQAQPQEHQIG